jgi:hypothetical protein
MFGGQKLTLCIKRNPALQFGYLEHSIEVAETGVGLIADALDTWGERHVRRIAKSLLIDDLYSLIFRHACGKDWPELPMKQQR